MSHQITSRCPVVVVDSDGRIVSAHRSERAARAAIERQTRALHRQPGSQHYYLPRSVIRLTDGRAIIERTGGSHSTAWVALQ